MGEAQPTEEAVLAMWAGILPHSPGPGVDFFDAGGQSLHLVQFLQQVYQRYRVDLEVTELFAEEFTARRAAAVIARAMEADAEVDDLADRLADLPEEEVMALLSDQTVEG
ncbi:acyl carrier protein [Actinoplanes utahensis]|nr:acyl carrier protein [Actinoplanes utahensis]